MKVHFAVRSHNCYKFLCTSQSTLDIGRVTNDLEDVTCKKCLKQISVVKFGIRS